MEIVRLRMLGALLVSLLWLILLLPVHSAEQSAAVNWDEPMQSGTNAYRKGDYLGAESSLSKALTIIDADDAVDEADERKLLILGPLANAMVKQAKFAEAEALYRRALSICETRYGADDANVGTILGHLAGVSVSQRRYAEAQPFFTRAIAIAEKTRGANDPEVARLCIELGTMYFKQKKSADAEAQFKRAEAIYAQKYGADDKTVAEALAFRALSARQERRYVDAEELLKQSIAIYEKRLGPDNPQTVVGMDALSAVYMTQGKYQQAEALAKKVLSANEKAYGAESKQVARNLESLAVLAMGAGNYIEAEQLAKRTLALDEKLTGIDSPQTLGGIRLLVTLYVVQKEDAAALPLLERAYAIQKKAKGQEHSEVSYVLNQIARINRQQGNNQKAEELYRTLLAKDQQMLGANSPAVAADLDNLARVLDALGNSDESHKLREQALAIKKNLPGSAKLSATLTVVKIGKRGPAGVPVQFYDSRPKKGSTGTPKIGSIGRPMTQHNRPVADKWALVVGITNFRDSSLNLQYAAKDATDFRNYLINEANFKPDHVKLLTDSQATRDSIVNSLGETWLGRLADKDDLVVVYISSHGSSATDEAKGTNFVVTHETTLNNLILTGIPMQWLTAGIAKMVPSDRLVLVLDVCHAGAARSTPSTHGASVSSTPASTAQPKDGKGLARAGAQFNVDGVVLGNGQVLIASSDADQTSYESKNYKNGVFTHCLLEGLRSRGANTSLSEACNIMRQNVEEEVLRDRSQIQTPVVVQNWEGEDVILGVIPARPRPAKP